MCGQPFPGVLPEAIDRTGSPGYTEPNSASWSLIRRWSREAGLQQYRRHNSLVRFPPPELRTFWPFCGAPSAAIRVFRSYYDCEGRVCCSLSLRLPPLRPSSHQHLPFACLPRVHCGHPSHCGSHMRRLWRSIVTRRRRQSQTLRGMPGGTPGVYQGGGFRPIRW
jgi:hypothetical protein